MPQFQKDPMEARIDRALAALFGPESAEPQAAELVSSVRRSLLKHLTPETVEKLKARGITVEEAVAFLARRALEAVIAEGRSQEA